MKLKIIKILIIKIKYSNKKIIAKRIEKYSKLKPDTNSDSHSIKSKGWRLDSHKKVMIKRKQKKGKKIAKYNLLRILNFLIIKIIIIKIKENRHS